MTNETNPLQQFEKWYEEATQKSPEPHAVALATADSNASPSVRIVYYKGMLDGAFSFYTGYDSKKGKDLSQNPKAAMVFYWRELRRQVRVEGTCKKMSKEESEKYFYTRDRESQISGLISQQSSEILSFKDFEEKIEAARKLYANQPIPFPENWGGFLLYPQQIEFWTGGEHRRHERLLFRQEGATWKTSLLSP